MLVLGQDSLCQQVLLCLKQLNLLLVLCRVCRLSDELGRLGRDPSVFGGTNLVEEALSAHAIALNNSQTLEVASDLVGVAPEA